MNASGENYPNVDHNGTPLVLSDQAMNIPLADRIPVLGVWNGVNQHDHGNYQR